MKKIGLLSDTHSLWEENMTKHMEICDEIWHAGDIGSMEVLERMEQLKPLRAVYGNIDDQTIRRCAPKVQRFEIEGVDVMMTHIGGYPGRYDREVLPALYAHPPKLFISGHSHILKVMYDKQLECLHINPGAAGKHGFHAVRTMVRFEVDAGNISNLEVIELMPR